jgi:hypothetical protein
MYPNPVALGNELNFSLSNFQPGVVQVTITDLLGRVVATSTTTVTEFGTARFSETIPVSGVFMVKISNQAQSVTRQVVVK